MSHHFLRNSATGPRTPGVRHSPAGAADLRGENDKLVRVRRAQVGALVGHLVGYRDIGSQYIGTSGINLIEDVVAFGADVFPFVIIRNGELLIGVADLVDGTGTGLVAFPDRDLLLLFLERVIGVLNSFCVASLRLAQL